MSEIKLVLLVFAVSLICYYSGLKDLDIETLNKNNVIIRQ